MCLHPAGGAHALLHHLAAAPLVLLHLKKEWNGYQVHHPENRPTTGTPPLALQGRTDVHHHHGQGGVEALLHQLDHLVCSSLDFDITIIRINWFNWSVPFRKVLKLELISWFQVSNENRKGEILHLTTSPDLLKGLSQVCIEFRLFKVVLCSLSTLKW